MLLVGHMNGVSDFAFNTLIVRREGHFVTKLGSFPNLKKGTKKKVKETKRCYFFISFDIYKYLNY